MSQILSIIGDALLQGRLTNLYNVLQKLSDAEAATFLTKLKELTCFDLNDPTIIQNLTSDDIASVNASVTTLLNASTIPTTVPITPDPTPMMPPPPVSPQPPSAPMQMAPMFDEDGPNTLTEHCMIVESSTIRDILAISPVLIALIVIIGCGILYWQLMFGGPIDPSAAKYADQIVPNLPFIMAMVMGWVFGSSIRVPKRPTSAPTGFPMKNSITTMQQ